MARQAAERSRGVELPGRTVDYVDDMQDAVNISVRAGADEAGTLPSLTRESGGELNRGYEQRRTMPRERRGARNLAGP